MNNPRNEALACLKDVECALKRTEALACLKDVECALKRTRKDIREIIANMKRLDQRAGDMEIILGLLGDEVRGEKK